MLIISAIATIAVFALAPLYTPTVLAAAYDAVAGPLHQRAGG